MALDPKLLEILACPKDKGPLLYFADEESLYNPRLRMRYRITDDIPVMLIDEAEIVSDEEAARLEAKASADGIEPNWSESSS
ncbi:MAG TPA: Trm112 family protein [Acidimicrobiales bacterium]|nr:Trm112 family protein [Acidimicrobiales bacterium]